uniref:Uncharacterized protein n=1 Tax=Trichobilharzia regenti TaxID=157069 RepID=A0AA85JCS4_TRIRE|nr:unnamed protein product [Trichobilharzia regenti]
MDRTIYTSAQLRSAQVKKKFSQDSQPHTVRAICSEEVIEDELSIVHDTLIENIYTEKFIKKHMTKKAEKKPLYIRLQFNGDIPSEIITKKLRKSVQRNVNPGQLHVLFSTRPMMLPRLKAEAPRLASHFKLYLPIHLRLWRELYRLLL